MSEVALLQVVSGVPKSTVWRLHHGPSRRIKLAMRLDVAPQWLDPGAPVQAHNSPASASSARRCPSRCLPKTAPCSPTLPPCRSAGATAFRARSRAVPPSRSRSSPHRPCSRGSGRPGARVQHRADALVCNVVHAQHSPSLIDSRSGPRPRPRRPRSGTPHGAPLPLVIPTPSLCHPGRSGAEIRGPAGHNPCRGYRHFWVPDQVRDDKLGGPRSPPLSPRTARQRRSGVQGATHHASRLFFLSWLDIRKSVIG